MALLHRSSSFPSFCLSLVSDACLLFDDFSLSGSRIFASFWFSFFLFQVLVLEPDPEAFPVMLLDFVNNYNTIKHYVVISDYGTQLTKTDVFLIQLNNLKIKENIQSLGQTTPLLLGDNGHVMNWWKRVDYANTVSDE